MCAVWTEEPTTEHQPTEETVGSVVSPSEVRRFGGLPDAGLPPAGAAAAAAGRRLAQHPLLSARRGAGGEQEWLSGVQLLLAPLGIHLDLLKLRDGGAVLRCTATHPVPRDAACDLTKAILDLPPDPGGSGHGTVVENSCMKRGAEACLYMLLWHPSRSTDEREAHSPTGTALPAAPAPTGRTAETAPVAAVAADRSPAPPAVPGATAFPMARTPPPAQGRAVTPAPIQPVPRPTTPAGVPEARPSPAAPSPLPVFDDLATSVVAPSRLPEWPEPLPDHRFRQLGDQLAGGLRRLSGTRSRPAAGSRRAPWLRRRAWLLVLATLAGAVGGLWAGKHEGISYSAQATLVVQSGSGRSGPGSANDANALAITYSALLPTDSRITGAAGRALGVSASTVSRHLSVSVETDTAVLLLKYHASSPAQAVRGAQTVARVAAGSAPPSAAIPGGSLAVVQLPSSASVAGSLHKDGLPLGLVLGLAVGAILVIAAERTDPRIDGPEQLGAACHCPATAVPGGMSPTEMARAISRVAGPASRVTVVPLTPVDDPPARALGRALATDRTSGEPVFDNGPAFETNTDELATGAGPTVLVAGYGTPRRRVQAAVGRLRLLGREPLWAVLADSAAAEPEVPSGAR